MVQTTDLDGIRNISFLSTISPYVMNWIPIISISYVLLVLFVCLRVIYDTRSYAKALAYLLFVIFVPVFGMLFYFAFGINYRKRKLFNTKHIKDAELLKKLREDTWQSSKEVLLEGGAALESNKELAIMLARESMSPLTSHNSARLLVNGENKFPEVLKAIREAKHHIHIQYYIYEDDETGKAIELALIEKAKEGVIVRFIYDDFGSGSIRKKLVPRLKEANVHTFPFYKVIFFALANRINYRNHRKIVVVDGHIGFVGGINVSDKYVNDGKNNSGKSGSGSAKEGSGQEGKTKGKGKEKLFWRDTHLRIDGPGVQYLQYLFFCDWNFSAKDDLQPDQHYFPKASSLPVMGNKIVQIAASGPDSDKPTILFSLLQVINLASKEILITTPYFIPGDSIMDALMISALGGVKVKLLVPHEADTALVNAASRSYFLDLLTAGVEIYQYKKGFVHAKTVVADKKIAVVGSANIDARSFDLNFEVNAIVYDIELATELANVFYDDIADAEKIDLEAWKARPLSRQFLDKVAGLVSPLL